MYHLMLVDDEPDIREGLQEVVDFKKYGFEIVGEAENGIDALQLCETLRPDVVITDIRMPLMDGITMCREMRKILPMVQFVILSGYDDFEFAQQAIELSSIRYLLKPITSQEFSKILMSLRKRLDEEFDRRRNLTTLKQHFLTSLPLLREMLFTSLANGSITQDAARKLAEQCSVSLDARQYVLALFRVLQTGQSGQGAIDDPQLQWIAVQDIAKEVISQKYTAHFFYNGYAEHAVLFMLPSTDDRQFADVLCVLEEVQKNVEHYLSVKVLIGVSAPCYQIGELSFCAKQAVSALDQSSILAKDQVLCVTDLEMRRRNVLVADQQSLLTLSNGLKTHDFNVCIRAADDLIHALNAAEPSPRTYRAYMTDVCSSILRSVQELAGDIDEDPHDFEQTLAALMHCPPAPRARELLLDYCKLLMRSIDNYRITNSQKMVQQAREIALAHYGDEDMGAETVCQKLHISASYFGALFKRETGTTFHHYLIQLRMEKAMAMLAAGTARTAEVAEAVGIPDPSYFSYAFKKYFGVSPSEARRKRGL